MFSDAFLAISGAICSLPARLQCLHFVAWLLRLQDLRLRDATNNAKVT